MGCGERDHHLGRDVQLFGELPHRGLLLRLAESVDFGCRDQKSASSCPEVLDHQVVRGKRAYLRVDDSHHQTKVAPSLEVVGDHCIPELMLGLRYLGKTIPGEIGETQTMSATADLHADVEGI